MLRTVLRAGEDVFALRWESARTGKSGYSPAVVDGWRAGKRRPVGSTHLHNNLASNRFESAYGACGVKKLDPARELQG